MPFRFAARTILHLGSELISSDSIAFYELIKNAFDAKSTQVRIKVVVRCPDAADFLAELGEIVSVPHTASEKSSRLDALKRQAHQGVDRTAPDAEELIERLKAAKAAAEVERALREANYIEIADTGHGMSIKDLDEVYLTIGTRARLVEKREMLRQAADSGKKPDVILGEKGVGRLAAMRLGSRLSVKTSKEGEKRWNLLNIDWDLFSHDSDEAIESIAVEPERGDEKEDPDSHGTVIHISSLTSRWSLKKLEQIVINEVSKFIDPFTPQEKQRLFFRYNGELVPIPKLSTLLFDNAHAVVEFEFGFEARNGAERPVLKGRVDYVAGGDKREFRVSGDHLLSVANARLPTLRTLGHYTGKFYWFNRQALEAVEGIGEKKQVQELVNRWSGGLMVFRDGFRVSPYGDRDDDWLDLDRKALASSGYKVNRKQIVGKIDITTAGNAYLVDQTNREGLRECAEKEALVHMLKHVIESEFRAYINEVDKKNRAQQPFDLETLRGRVVMQRRQVKAVLNLLVSRYPQVKKDPDLIPVIEQSLERIGEAMRELDEVAVSYEEKQAQMLHLASLGLLAEILAHELWRATNYALTMVSDIEHGRSEERGPAAMRTLSAQLKTLQKRLQILDPVNSSARQVKTTFDLGAQVADLLKTHAAQFERHGIKAKLKFEPADGPKFIEVKMVKGMVIQIFENLLFNAVYWLKRRKENDRKFEPEITVTLDSRRREMRVADNGPGVEPERKEEIFRPFVTTKPPGEGKGLGLYIAREIAKYHNVSLYLDDTRSAADGNLSTFVLELK